MRTSLGVFLLATLSAAAAFVLSASSVRADKAFRDEFLAKYAKAGTAPQDSAFAAACQQANCAICHLPQNRKQYNAYGEALRQLLNRKTDKRNKPKIQAALDKVAAAKSDPKDPKAPTFGELFKAGKLPGESKDAHAVLHSAH